MKIPHLAVPALIFLGAAVSAAQSYSASPVSPATNLPRLLHLDTKNPSSWPGLICDTFGAPVQQEASAYNKKPSEEAPLDLRQFRHILKLNVIPPTCYKLRAYAYTVPNWNNGQIRWTGMTTCQPATSFRMKSAILTPTP
jgi:hypothetical protein